MEQKKAAARQYDKALVPGMIELVTQGLTTANMVDEAEAVLTALHVLRPDMRSFEIFQAWIMIKRGRYLDASHVLRAFDGVPQMRPMATALMAVCNFGLQDPEWRANVEEVLSRNEHPEAVALVNRLIATAEGRIPEEETAAPAAEPAPATAGQSEGGWVSGFFSRYLRA